MDDAYIIRAGGKDGFMDEAGNVVQAPVFEDMAPFHAGFAAYKLGGKWGVVDATGVRRFAPRYDGILLEEPMECGFPVRLGERWGYARLDGTLFVPAVYKTAQSFSEGLAAVEDDADVLSYIDERGMQRFLDRIGGPERFMSGRKRIELRKGQAGLFDGLYGYLDTTGAVAIEPRYLIATSHFCHGRATVKTANGYGIIDPDGRWVVEDCFMRIGHPWHGHATVRIDERTWAIVDVSGRKSWQCQAHDLSTVFHGLVRRTDESGLDGLWDVHGKEIIPTRYRSLEWNGTGMVAMADESERYGIMDLRSGFIGECRFKDVPAAFGNLWHVGLNDEAMRRPLA
jgi:hypothetical protein